MKGFINAIFISALGLSASAFAETSPWAVNDPGQEAVVTHQPITEIINYFGDVKRDYTSLDFNAIEGAGSDYLRDYLDYLESLPVSQLNRDEQLAYWLNLRNAMVTYMMSTRDTPRRIDDYRGTPEQPGSWWQEKTLTVEGHELSLADIEQEVLASNWSDSLFIYGLYDGSISGPSLGETAFIGATVHEQLEESARQYINDDDRVDVSRRGVVTVSDLYQWHKSSFGDDAALLSHLVSYAEPRLAEDLIEANTINEYDFNGSIARHTIRTFTLDSYGTTGGGS